MIDIKDPAAGALGAASFDAIRSIVEEVDGCRAVTAAAGELEPLEGSIGFLDQLGQQAGEIALVKVGLSGTNAYDWQEKAAKLCQRYSLAKRLVLCAYADWQQCGAPSPTEVLEATVSLRLDWMLIDTFNKQSGGLFTHLSAEEIESLISESFRLGVRIVLAGKLLGADLALAASCAPAMVGVRTAICRGGRQGVVDGDTVRRVRDDVRRARERHQASCCTVPVCE